MGMLLRFGSEPAELSEVGREPWGCLLVKAQRMVALMEGALPTPALLQPQLPRNCGGGTEWEHPPSHLLHTESSLHLQGLHQRFPEPRSLQEIRTDRARRKPLPTPCKETSLLTSQPEEQARTGTLTIHEDTAPSQVPREAASTHTALVEEGELQFSTMGPHLRHHHTSLRRKP